MTDQVHPADLLEPLGMTEIEIGPGVRISEIYTMSGMVGLMWFGPIDAERLVVACNGGMGGFLGPGRGMFPAIGRRLADDGIATVSVDYRRPSHLQLSVLDAIAAVDLAAQRGASRVVAIGHSFGGAVAVNVGLALPRAVAGVCTLSTQSAGCEGAAGLAPRPFLLIHGSDDDVLPAETSEVVQMLAGGHGDVQIVPGEGHGLSNNPQRIIDRVCGWVASVFD
ncbi:MAG: hypothetical protein JWM34_1532 [Ilumatobacteraceae bacterium]|nr:hypothetical protein [Ilumatobacteraceae bacterium]